MPQFTVSYTTNERPADLPAGAKVERVSLLPFRLETGRSRKVEVTKTSIEGSALLALSETLPGGDWVNARLDKEQVMDLIEALAESIGVTVPVEAPAGRNLRTGDKVRLANNDNGRVSTLVEVGTVGEVTGALDSDGEYFVKFPRTTGGFTHQYAHHTQLTRV